MTWRMFPINLPTIVQGHLFVLLLLVLGMGKAPHYDSGVLCVYWRDWVAKRWRFTTTIGGGMGKADWFSERTRFHELCHIHQYEDMNLFALVLGACLIPWLGWQGMVILWATSGALWYVPGYLAAAIRNFARGVGFMEAVYRGCEIEKSAYAQTYREFH